MLRRLLKSAAAPRLDHRFDDRTDFCTVCGVHRTNVRLNLWPARCPAAANVTGISHILALRHLAATAETTLPAGPQPH
ncbi:MAG TPA: hypothetical protein VN668_13905 [Stellaceae bacterium]|nr:hypothetical protein [Stellaceae bacterium]